MQYCGHVDNAAMMPTCPSNQKLEYIFNEQVASSFTYICARISLLRPARGARPVLWLRHLRDAAGFDSTHSLKTR